MATQIAVLFALIASAFSLCSLENSCETCIAESCEYILFKNMNSQCVDSADYYEDVKIVTDHIRTCKIIEHKLASVESLSSQEETNRGNLATFESAVETIDQNQSKPKNSIEVINDAVSSDSATKDIFSENNQNNFTIVSPEATTEKTTPFPMAYENPATKATKTNSNAHPMLPPSTTTPLPDYVTEVDNNDSITILPASQHNVTKAQQEPTLVQSKMHSCMDTFNDVQFVFDNISTEYSCNLYRVIIIF